MKNRVRSFVAAVLLSFLATVSRAQQAPAAGDAEIAQLKQRLAQLEAAKSAAAGSASNTVATQAPDTTPPFPLDKSDLVTKDANGALVIADKTGDGIDGIKLSQHDAGIASPSIAVAPDGTIHVAFLETNSTAKAIYHRSSSDGGKTWTEAKNLTEDLLTMSVGRCQVLADARNRVYVIWRAAIPGNFDVGTDLGGSVSSLWFRELEGGKWTKPKPVSEITGVPPSNDAAYSFFAAVDAAGQAQVVWNAQPGKWHPEVMTPYGQARGVGPGLVFQCPLDGTSAGKPREVFLPVITLANNLPWPKSTATTSDGLDTLNGYIDATGAAHFVARVTRVDEAPAGLTHYELIENGKTGQNIDLPQASSYVGTDIPTLLVDAKGKRHLIALYLAGDHSNIRDYPLGTDDEAAVIRATVGLNGGILGFQACQGPGGRMVVFMQMNDTGAMHSGDNFVSMSTGDGKWSVPVNMTNNAGRKTSQNTQTSAQSNVGQITSCMPGQCAAAFDKDGHLVVLLIKGEYKIVLASALGVNTAGGDVTIPTLRFLRF